MCGDSGARHVRGGGALGSDARAGNQPGLRRQLAPLLRLVERVNDFSTTGFDILGSVALPFPGSVWLGQMVDGLCWSLLVEG